MPDIALCFSTSSHAVQERTSGSYGGRTLTYRGICARIDIEIPPVPHGAGREAISGNRMASAFVRNL
jgi:hypothetical protein